MEFIDFYRKDDNIHNKFIKYKLKKFKIRKNCIFLSAKNDVYIWHCLNRYSIKELYYESNIIFIHWICNYNIDKNFFLKLIVKDKITFKCLKYYLNKYLI